jgi:hypothetical protein
MRRLWCSLAVVLAVGPTCTRPKGKREQPVASTTPTPNVPPLDNLGCSVSSGTVDSPLSHPQMTPSIGASRVNFDSGLHVVLLPFEVAKTVESTDSSDSVKFEMVEAAASVSSNSSSPAIEPSQDRSYLLPLGDPLTSRRAMATKYADLSPNACRAELRRRRISVGPARTAWAGITAPMRLTEPLHNVRFLTPGPKSVHGLLDCRLVLLLDELASVLEPAGVTTIYVDGFYRPKAHLPGKKALSQHAFGLAIDMHAFGTKGSRTLVVERDFAGQIGAPVCGPSAAIQPESKDSIDLRNIVCAMARAKAFHYLLTPNHDKAHANHVHGDIKRGARQHVVR